MYSSAFYIHLLAVVILVLLTVVRITLLLTNKTARLDFVSKRTAIPERIIGVLILASGIYLMLQLPSVNLLLILKLLCVLAAIPLGIIAYRKKIKLLAIVSFGLIIGALVLVEGSKKQTARGTLTQVTAANGQALYIATCSQCHGADGRKGAAGAADLSKSKLDMPSIRQIIINGKGSMPAYKKILDDTQVTEIVNYVQKLKINLAK